METLRSRVALTDFFNMDNDFQMQKYANARSPMNWNQRRLFYIISHKYIERFGSAPEALWPLFWEQANERS